MYVPKMFLIAVAFFIAYQSVSRWLTCQSKIGRMLARPGMMVGCRKRNDGGTFHCDVCSLYGGTSSLILGGAALVFAAIGAWQWFGR